MPLGIGAVDRAGRSRGARRRRPAIIAAVTVRTNSGAWAGTTGGARGPWSRSGTVTSCRAASVASTAASLRRTTSEPRRAYVFRMAALTFSIASSRGSDAGDREEAGLQHGVGASGQPGRRGPPCRVDRPDAEPLVDDLLLDRPREGVPDLVGGLGGVEQQRRPRPGAREDVDLLEEAEVVAADEAGLGDEVGRPDGVRAEAKVRHGQRRPTSSSRRRSRPGRAPPGRSRGS